jgi:dynein heavy chain
MWIKEHDIFQNILKINFFKKFRIWKAFYFIKKRVIKKRAQRAINSLTKKLYILNSTLTRPLQEIRKLCLEITKINLFADNNGQILQIDDFTNLQENQKVKASEKLVEICEKITAIVSEACKNSMIAAGFGDKFKDISEINDVDLTETSTKQNRNMKNLLKSFTDQPYQMSYTELSQKRNECKRLMNCKCLFQKLTKQ